MISSAPRTTADSTTIAMLLADARLPSGAHAHSAGMEPALAGGMAVADVPAFLIGRARTTSLVEAGAAVVARHLALEGGDTRPVERAWAARTPAPAMRDAAVNLGRGLLRLASRVWPESDALRQAAARPAAPPRAVVAGMVAAVAGLRADDLVRLIVYDEAHSAAAAVLKLAPRDPVDPIGWVLEACAAVEHLVPVLAELTLPDAIPALGAPQAEGWAQAHAVLSQRLFRA